MTRPATVKLPEGREPAVVGSCENAGPPSKRPKGRYMVAMVPPGLVLKVLGVRIPTAKAGGFPDELSRSPGDRFWLRRYPVLWPSYLRPEPGCSGRRSNRRSRRIRSAGTRMRPASDGWPSRNARRRSRPRGIARIDQHDWDAGIRRLVGNEPSELVERPTREPIASVPTPSRCPVADAFEVFEGNPAAGVFGGLDDRFADAMVLVPPESGLLPGYPAELLLCPWVPFRVERQ
jgi:hypothetical protein